MSPGPPFRSESAGRDRYGVRGAGNARSRDPRRRAADETTGNGYQRPRDQAEIWLARQWQHMLGFTVGIRENFFGVGGNSLDAARVIDAVLAELGVQLPLNVLTEHPTVVRLATLRRDHAERLAYALGEEFAVSGIQAAAIGTGRLEPPGTGTGTETWSQQPPGRRPQSSSGTSAARTGAWPARSASCSADQR